MINQENNDENKEMFTDGDLESIKKVINNEINLKLNVMLNSGMIDIKDPLHFRNITRSIVARSIDGWGFTPSKIDVIGPNDDNKVSIDFVIDLNQGNSLTG